MKNLKLYGKTSFAAAALLVSAGVAAQEIIPVETPLDTNLVGLGVFGVPDYYGSSKNEGAAAPILHYGFGDDRYVRILGPEIRVNLVPGKLMRAGPLLRFRSRRDDDVDDSVVRQMRPVPTATEWGVFGEYHLPLDQNPMHKLVFSADLVGNTTQVYNGLTGNIKANYVHPFADQVAGYSLIGTVGFGLFFASESFNTRYFGVTGADLALYPSLAGRPYTAGSGLTSIKIPFSLSTQLNKEWLLSFAGRYERLLNDAKDSPVVDQRGDANQWSVGVAASYLF